MDRLLFFYQKIFKTLIFIGFFSLPMLLPGSVTFAVSPEIGVVAVDRLNMRQGSGIGYPIVNVLQKNDRVEVLARSNGWIKIRHKGDAGYVSDERNYIRLNPEPNDSGKSEQKLDAAAASAEDIRRKIKETSSEVTGFNRQEKEILSRLDKTDRALSDARRKAAALEFKMKVLSEQITETTDKAFDVQKAIDESSEYAVKRLVALYKADRLGEANLLASATTLNDLLRRKSALQKILDDDSRVVAALAAEKKRLSGLMRDWTDQKEKQEILKADYQKTITELSGEKAERERLLSEIKEKKTNRLTTIKYLKAAAKEMDKTIEALRQEQIRAQKKAEAKEREEAREKARALAQKETLESARKAALEKEREAAEKKQADMAKNARTPKAEKSKKSEKPEKARVEKPVHAAKVEKKPAIRTAPKSASSGDFAAHQGLLKMPVNGNIVTRFGKYIEPQSGAVNIRNGIEIKTRQGTPIRAVFSGETIFSSWLKGYGNVIIIAHGEHFHTVYAHVEEVYSAKGKPVEAGEVIATVGDSGSMVGPSLYFEIRHKGSPVDPLQWVNKN
jgi:septal ring factor EnvC (AmiA/AmiB activator)